MQNVIGKLSYNSIVFTKLGILSEKLKTLTSSNYDRVKYFLLKYCTLSHLPKSTKWLVIGIIHF